MAAGLSAFLAQAAARGFVWGEHDCMLFAADWAREVTGLDPAVHYRFAYRSADSAREIVMAAGGAEALLDAAAASIGWRKIDGPRQAGDIALVAPPLHPDLTTAVCVSARNVALLTQRGLLMWAVPVIAAWRHG